MARSSSPYSDRRERLDSWFFQEYNHQWVNYKKFYLAANYYEKVANYLNYAIGAIGTVLVITILAIVRQVNLDFLTPFALGSALLVGLLAAADSVKGYERKHVRYYRVGQRMDDLYTEMEHMVKVRLPDPSEDDAELEYRCLELIRRKDDLNGSAPQLSDKWYKRLKEQERTDQNDLEPLKWEMPSLIDRR